MNLSKNEKIEKKLKIWKEIMSTDQKYPIISYVQLNEEKLTRMNWLIDKSNG